MNVYDFDGTVYDGNSSVDFYFFVLKRHPAVLKCLPKFLKNLILYKMGKRGTKELKECFFSFLPKIPDVLSEVDMFWKTNMKKIKPWYIAVKRPSDIIISASPDFLLRTPCRILGTGTLIATSVDIKSGKIIGENCKGEEKAKKFRAGFPAEKIEEFYSDSVSDTPMAAIAEKAYFIKKGKIKEWGSK